MENIEIITATEASRHFSDLLHRVFYGGESFVIKKGNRMMAMIAPVEQGAAPVQQAAEPLEMPVAISHYSIEPKQEEGFSPGEAEYFKALLDGIRKAPIGVE